MSTLNSVLSSIDHKTHKQNRFLSFELLSIIDKVIQETELVHNQIDHICIRYVNNRTPPTLVNRYKLELHKEVRSISNSIADLIHDEISKLKLTINEFSSKLRHEIHMLQTLSETWNDPVISKKTAHLIQQLWKRAEHEISQLLLEIINSIRSIHQTNSNCLSQLFTDEARTSQSVFIIKNRRSITDDLDDLLIEYNLKFCGINRTNQFSSILHELNVIGKSIAEEITLSIEESNQESMSSSSYEIVHI